MDWKLVNQLLLIFVFSLLTALATGLGVLPFFFIKSLDKNRTGLFNAISAGLMLGASLDLVIKGVGYSYSETVLGIIAGFLVIVLAQYLLRGVKHFDPSDLVSASKKRMVVIVGIMTVHSFAEGISMGAAFADTVLFGTIIFVAMALQNIPEGLAISTVLCPKGVSPWKAMGWSIFSSLPQPLMAVPAFLFIDHFRVLLPGALGFAAGAMFWVIFDDLIPESRTETSYWLPTVSLSTLLMVGLIFLV